MNIITNSLGNEAFVQNLVQIKNIDEDLSQLHKSENFTVIGGGNNIVLVSPSYFKTTIVQVLIGGIRIIRKENNFVFVEAGAGEEWCHLVKFCLKNDFGGLENLTSIPGSVGAAPVQNIGAYGVELSQVFDSCLVYDKSSREKKYLNRKDCQFTYRDSVFKKTNNYVILKIVLKLTAKIHCLNIGYSGLSEGTENIICYKKSMLKNISNLVSKIRSGKLPNPKQVPNAGSFFKNPLVSGEEAELLKNNFSNLVMWRHSDKFIKLSAASLIDHIRASLKDHSGVSLYDKHSLIVINPLHNSGQCILDFANEIIEQVRIKFGVQLEMEVQLIVDL